MSHCHLPCSAACLTWSSQISQLQVKIPQEAWKMITRNRAFSVVVPFLVECLPTGSTATVFPSQIKKQKFLKIELSRKALGEDSPHVAGTMDKGGEDYCNLLFEMVIAAYFVVFQLIDNSKEVSEWVAYNLRAIY